MTRNRTLRLGWYALAVATITLGGSAQAQEHTGTVRQPLVGGAVVDQAAREEFGLLDFNPGVGACSASLLRHDWAITAAHCVELNGETKPTPDASRPGQNLLNPLGAFKLTANWKTVQEKRVVRVETFRPYDIALLKMRSPFQVHGATSGYSVFRNAIRLRLSSGDRPSPNGWPGTARFSIPNPFNPVGT